MKTQKTGFIDWIFDGNDTDTGIKTTARFLISTFIIPFILLYCGIAWLIGCRVCKKCGKIISPFGKRVKKSHYSPSYGSWMGGNYYEWYECMDCALQESKNLTKGETGHEGGGAGQD